MARESRRERDRDGCLQWGLVIIIIFFCQQQMPGTVVSTGHTLKHNTAALSASGHRIERGGRRREEREAEEDKKKDRE